MIEIWFRIEISDMDIGIDFMNEYEDDECVDGYSFHPFTGQTGYTKWHDGWREIDEPLEEFWSAIRDYSESLELFELVSSFTKDDIGVTYETSYYCDGYVEENNEYDFKVICQDVTEESE